MRRGAVHWLAASQWAYLYLQGKQEACSYLSPCVYCNLKHTTEEEGRGGNAAAPQNNSLPLQRRVCEQHIEFAAAVWQTHAAQRRSLRKRDPRKLPFERCYTDEVPACVPEEAIRRRGARWKREVCAVSRARPWPGSLICLICVCYLVPPSESQECYSTTRWHMQQGAGMRENIAYVCQCKSYSICWRRLTSFIAFLRRLGFSGQARVQPSGGFAVVTEVKRKRRQSFRQRKNN